jgi:hypothetical protein
MKVPSFTARLVAIGILTAMASAVLLTGTASAATEKACNDYFCNKTHGNGKYVQYVEPDRKWRKLRGKYGFFEVFGPRGYKKTGPSSVHSPHIPISRSFPRNSLICLRFFENVDGDWVERGSAARTRIPIG